MRTFNSDKSYVSSLAMLLITMGWWCVLGQELSQPRTGHFSFDEEDLGKRAFVIPLDFQKGVQLSPASPSPWIQGQLYGYYPWFLKRSRPVFYRLSIVNGSADYSLYNENPIAAFGSQAGGSTLYIGSSYRFIFYAGGQTPLTDFTNELNISVYRRSDFVEGAAWPSANFEHGLDIPHTAGSDGGQSAQPWKEFGEAGFSRSFTTIIGGNAVLETTVQYISPSDLPEGWTGVHHSPLVISHRALEGAEDYYFSVAAAGRTKIGDDYAWMAVADPENPAGSPTHYQGYAMNFDAPPPWMSTLVKSPNFEGNPAPSSYYGKTAEEIAVGRPRFDLQFAAPAPGEHRELAAHPELQPHSILDRFVAQFNGNPIALANFVHNEIELTDALSYNEDGEVDAEAVNAGGINRGALATFQEERGSPDEQCALLVYLLRKAGVPALYVESSPGAVKMRDQDLSKLLRMRIADLIAPDGSKPVPELIGVNYPWVAAYVTEQGQSPRWVHLFPWLKETEVREGLSIEGYLPPESRSTQQWLRNYLLADQDSPLWELDQKNRTPLNIFELDFQRSLQQNWPGLSIDNFGVRFRDRKMNRKSWGEFPQPTSIDAEGGSFSTSSGIGVDEAFDTFDIEIGSVEVPSNKITLTGLRTMDFHNRRAIVNFIPGTGSNYALTFTLEPYDLTSDSRGVIPAPGTGDFTYAGDFGLNRKQVRTLGITGADKNFTFKVTYHRHRSYPGADPGVGDENLGGWSHFLGVRKLDYASSQVATATETTTAGFKLGDLSAFCLNAGTVTEKMLLTHLEHFWQHESQRRANPYTTPTDYDLIQGTTTYLMGMSYYKNVGRSVDRFKDLFKLNVVSMRAHGFARFEAKRNSNGIPVTVSVESPSGTETRIDQIYPAVDMFFNRNAWAGYGDLRPDAGGQGMANGLEHFGILISEISAQEHETIDRYVNIEEEDSVSSVNLLHLVQQDGNALTNIVELTSDDFTAKGAITYSNPRLGTKTLAAWVGPSTWSEIQNVFASGRKDRDYARVYVTPGPVKGAGQYWEGMGTLILSRGNAAAYIDKLNGGVGRPVFVSAFDTGGYSFSNTTLTFNSAGTISMEQRIGFSSASTPGGFVKLTNPSAAVNSYVGFSPTIHTPANLTFMGVTGGSSSQEISFAHAFYNQSGGLHGIEYSGSFRGTSHTSAGASIHFGDPVNSITGELYIDEVDLALPGPIPLQVRRNYSSQSQTSGNFGVGWKMAYFPFMVPRDRLDTKFSVAELDGSIVNYELDSQLNEYVVKPESNVHLTNGSGLAIGSVNNLFRNRIKFSFENGQYLATLVGADGSKRVFKREPSYIMGPFLPGQNIHLGLPFRLLSWQDANGNTLKFLYFDVLSSQSLQLGAHRVTVPQGSHRIGLLARVEASNGNFVTFDYNGNGHIVEALTGDGRRVTYSYNDEGDLTEVIRPDGSWMRYEYLFEKAKVGTTQVEDWYSTHLIKREVHPGGRAVESYYETYELGDLDDAGEVIAFPNTEKVGKASHRRRVVMQKATVGKHTGAADRNEVADESYEPIRNGTYTYFNEKDEETGFISGRTEILDAYDRKTIYYYTNNRLTRIVDPLSNVIDVVTGESENPNLVQQWWTAADVANGVAGAYTGALRSMQERGGAESQFYYSSDGDLTEVRVIGDFDGDGAVDTTVTTATYNERHLPELIVHPDPETGAASGKRTRYHYEDTSRPYLATHVDVLDKNGSTLLSTSFDYYDVGGTSAPFSRGLLRESRSAVGTSDQALTRWEHDARGFPTRKTEYSGHSDQVNYPDRVTEYEVNLRGEVVAERFMGGGVARRATRYAYDDMGRPIWVERLDEDGRQVGWDYTYYNLTGEVEWKDGSRSNPEDYSYMRYDGGGRPVEQVTWRTRAKADGSGVEAVPGAEGYATTKFFYNLFGDVIKTMDPRGNTVRSWYDDIGRTTATEAYEGDWESGGVRLARETTAYHDLQRRVVKTDSRGGITDSYFTANGNPRRVIKPDGTELEWRYFLDGRVRREPMGHYVYSEYEYDDRNRLVTKRIKNLAGLTLGSETTELDRRGNVVRSTDLAGHSVTATYDKLNRVVSSSVAASTASARQVMTYQYDATGARQKVINVLGESTETLMDALGRPESVVTRSSGGTVVSQSSMSYTTDHHGVTSTSGTGPGAVVTHAWTDLAGRPLVQRNAGGSFTRVDYDAAGNAVAGIDELGRITRSTYDGLNRLKTTQLPDSATTQFTYLYPAGGGERIERSMPGALTEVAIIDAVGRPTGSHLLGVGGAQTRTQQGFVYHTGGREKGLLAQFTDPRGLVHAFTYDDWLRPATSSIGVPGSDAYVSREVLGYDVRGMVTRLRETTAAGVSEVVRIYDGQSHLASEQVLLGNGAGSLESVSHLVNRYDGAGRRILLGKDDSVAPLGSGHGGSWNFGHRADGRLTSVASGGGAFQYGYGDNGLLYSRSNPFRQYSVPTSGGRDNRGRLRAVNTRLSGQSVDLLGEAITGISENSLQLSYSATRRVDPNSETDLATWTDTRSYDYNLARLNLVFENWTTGPNGGQKEQIHQQDRGTIGGPGVRTGSQVVEAFPGAGNQYWLVNDPADQDAFSRIETELSGHEQLPLLAYGTALGAGKVELSINESQKFHGTFFPAATRTTTGVWDHPSKLPAGSYTMKGRADHPSEQYHATAETQFQVGLGHFYIESTYDGSGNVETRTFRQGDGVSWRTQVLTWDGSGRLIKLSQQDINGAGFLWTARYDGLSRRIETSTVATRGGQPVVEAMVRERSWYDPHVEFLEVAFEVKRGTAESERWWLVHGPDLSGGYGGLQGMGGLEALINEATGESVGIIDDLYGHVLGFARAVTIHAAADGEIVYEAHSARFSGYGPISGTWSPAVAETTDAWRSFGWRGKRIEASGFYHMGARYYEPNSGRFLSADPLGHAASMGLYAYADGDPINLVDPWGRSAVKPGVGAVTNKPIFSARHSYMFLPDRQGLYLDDWDRTPASVTAALEVLADTAAQAASYLRLSYKLDAIASEHPDHAMGGRLHTSASAQIRAQMIQAGMDAATSAIRSNSIALRNYEFYAGGDGFIDLGGAWALKVRGEGAIQDISIATVYYSGEVIGGLQLARATMAFGTRLAGLSAAKSAPETFYRAMSQGHYDKLLATGKLPATGETFISPTKAFAANYDGVLVQFNVRGGTTNALAGVGVRDSSRLVGQAHGGLPSVSTVPNWNLSNAYFKAERGQINIGLGRGAGLDTFNRNILNFQALPK